MIWHISVSITSNYSTGPAIYASEIKPFPIVISTAQVNNYILYKVVNFIGRKSKIGKSDENKLSEQVV